MALPVAVVLYGLEPCFSIIVTTCWLLITNASITRLWNKVPISPGSSYETSVLLAICSSGSTLDR